MFCFCCLGIWKAIKLRKQGTSYELICVSRLITDLHRERTKSFENILKKRTSPTPEHADMPILLSPIPVS